jgi:hypothetical protein
VDDIAYRKWKHLLDEEDEKDKEKDKSSDNKK